MSLLAVDPLVLKELSGASRRWQTYAGRMFYVGAIGLVLHFTWIDAHQGNPLFSASESADLGRKLFRPFVLLQALFTLVASIASSAELFVREIKRGTMALLLATPLSVREIAFAKWRASLAQTGALVLSGLPIAAICFYLGGVGLLDVLGSAACAYSLGAFGGALALYFSGRVRSGYMAMIEAAAVLSLVTLGFLLALLFGEFFGLHFLVYGHPAFAALGLIVGGSRGLQLGWISASMFWLVMAYLVVRRSALSLEWRFAELDDPWKKRREQRASEIAAYHEAHGTTPVRVLTAHRVVWEGAPLLWKEFMTRPFLKLGEPSRRRLGFGLFFAVIAVWLVSDAGEETAILYAFGFLFLLMATLQGVLLFSAERGERNLDLLLSAPVSTRSLVGSKLLAGILVPEALTCLACWAFMLSLWSWRADAVGWTLIQGAGALLLAFAYLLGAHAALASRTTRGAFLLAGGVLACLLIAVPLACDFLAPSWRSGRGMAGTADIIVALTRPSILLSAAEDRLPIRRDNFLLLFGTAYGMAILLLLAGLPARFDRVVRRGGIR